MADIKAIPERIWVQWYGDGEPSEGVYDDEPVTWCEDKINEHDVEYVKTELFHKFGGHTAECGFVKFHLLVDEDDNGRAPLGMSDRCDCGYEKAKEGWG